MVLQWEPLQIDGVSDEVIESILIRLDRELQSWLGTPFLPGQMVKGMGVDCVHYTCAVLDEMYRTRRAHRLPRLRQDTALNNPDASAEAVRAILALYPDHRELDGFIVQPGDVITTGASHGGVGHTIMAGVRENEYWHAQGRGVKRTGADALTRIYDSVFKAYRITDKYKWA